MNQAAPQAVADEQLQKTRADVRNILPYDLYECMKKAATLKAEMMNFGEIPSERRVKEFYDSFWSLFQFTALKVNPEISRYIKGWFTRISLPIDNRDDLIVGIELYLEFYNELVKMGIGSMFENPIEPPLGGSLEDELEWAVKNIEILEAKIRKKRARLKDD